MNVAALIAERARATPDAVALRLGDGRTVTYGALERRCGRLAAAFQRRGIAAGAVVLVLQPVSPALYELLIALFRLGAVAAVPDASALRGSVTAAARRLRPQGVAGPAPAHLLRLLVPSLLTVPAACVTRGWVPGAFGLERAASAGEPAPVVDLPAGHAALITFTSGSTGTPKAIIRTHALLLAQQGAIAPVLGLRPGMSVLTTLPMFVLSLLAAGATAVLPAVDVRRPAEIDAGRLLEQIAATGVEQIIASPAVCERLAGHPAAARGLGGVRSLFTGGGPVFPDILDRLAEHMPAARLVAAYGSSEAEPISHLDRAAITAEDRATVLAGGGLPVGQPVPEAAVAILPDRFGAPLGPWTAAAFVAARRLAGQAGEIVVAGDHVVPGYLDGIGDAECKLHAGGRVWHRTGDAGRFDAHGRLWLLGRCSARLGDGYPLAIEAAARAILPGCRCACLAVDGRPCLVVEALSPDQADHLVSRWRSGTPPAIRSVERIPMDRRHQSKVDYPRLRAMLADGR